MAGRDSKNYNGSDIVGIAEILSNFVNSGFFKWFVLPIIVFIIILWMISNFIYNEPIGVVIGRWMGRKPLKSEDIEIDAQGMALKDFRESAIQSKPHLAKYLYIESTDRFHYATEGGRHYLGKISGMATYPSHDEIMYRRPWHIKKWHFVYPPDLLASSSCSKNIVVQGISVKTKGDIAWPSLSKGSIYTEDQLDMFAQFVYDMRVVQNENMMTRNLMETSLAKAAAERADVRQRDFALRHHIQLEEASDAERNAKSHNQG